MEKVLAAAGGLAFLGIMAVTGMAGGSFLDCIYVAAACAFGAGISAVVVYLAHQVVAQRSG